MANTARFPVRELAAVGDSRIVKLEEGEDQTTTLRRARVAIASQLARQTKNASTPRERRELERRVIVVEPRGKRSLVLRRLEDAAPAAAGRTATKAQAGRAPQATSKARAPRRPAPA